MTGGGGRAISTVWAVGGAWWGCARVSRANRVDPGSLFQTSSTDRWRARMAGA